MHPELVATQIAKGLQQAIDQRLDERIRPTNETPGLLWVKQHAQAIANGIERGLAAAVIAANEGGA